jgi:hypothetical protein
MILGFAVSSVSEILDSSTGEFGVLFLGHEENQTLPPSTRSTLFPKSQFLGISFLKCLSDSFNSTFNKEAKYCTN